MLRESPRRLPAITANPIDRIVSFFSPVAGARRARARMFEALLGAYNGASRSRRSIKEWNPGNGDADSDILWDLPYLRERSRDLIRNAPIATGAIGTSLANVVGTGLKLQSRIDVEYLGLTEEAADKWEDNAEREFRMWAESQECDISRTLNFVGLQALAFRQTLENGDVFALLPRINRKGSPYSLKIQLVEADRVCNSDRKPDDETLIAGVQKDPNTGAPTAYHIMNQHPGQVRVQKSDAYSWKVVPAFGSRTGLRNVLHLYEMLRPGQTRGVPFLAPVMEALKQISTLTENELMASAVASLFTVFLKSKDGGIDFDLSTTGMAGETGATASDTDIKMGNGNIVGLAENEEISTAAPGRPNGAFEPFFLAIVKQIGAALGIPFEVLMRCFSSSYSASRASLLEAWRFFRGRRVWLAAYFCQPIYEVWLYEAIASGRISAPGFFADPMIAKAYSGAEWTGDSPLYIDPQKDVDSAKARIDARLSTHDAETTLLTGGDFEKNVRQLGKEARMIRDAKLIDAPAAPTPGRPAEEDARSLIAAKKGMCTHGRGLDCEAAMIMDGGANFDVRSVDRVNWKRVYSDGNAHWTESLQPSRLAQEFAQKLVSSGKKSILEIGCGNGRDSILFARAGLNVTSIDLVPEAIENAKKNAEAAGVNIDFQVGNAESLEFPDSSFDALFTLSVLHSTNMDKSIPEVYRVLKNKGISLIYIYSDVEKIDGSEKKFVSIDEFVDLVKSKGFSLSDLYTHAEDEFDEAAEKHLIIISEVKK